MQMVAGNNPLAQLLKVRMCGTKANFLPMPPRRGEIRDSVGSPLLARQMLGLGAPVTLRQGLTETLAWLHAHRPAGGRHLPIMQPLGVSQSARL
jgi:hypothetical protein